MRDRRPTRRLFWGRGAMGEHPDRRAGPREAPGQNRVRDSRCPLHSLRPGEHLCSRRRHPVPQSACGPMSTTVCAWASSAGRRRPQSSGSFGDRTECSGQDVECLVQVCTGDYLRAPVIGDRVCSCADEEHGIRNPGEYLRTEQWSVEDFLARLPSATSDRRGCHCRPRRRIAGRAGGGHVCHTSYRSAPESPSRSWFRA